MHLYSRFFFLSIHIFELFFKLTPNYFFIQFYIKLFFALFTKNYNKVYFIYHSDALPFSRALIYCGYKFNFINVCIHHGIFSRDLEFSEIDGSLSDILITRSSHDASQVLSVNPNVKTIIEPNFFIIHITPINTLPKYILLIGEGWHRLDKKFAYSYIRKLKNLEKILLVNNFKVKYRPHPSERFNYFIYKFRFKKYDFLNLEQSLSMTHSVIGFSSTLLIDSSAIGINSYNISVYNKFCSDLSLHGQKVNKVISTNNLLKMLSHDASKINKFDKLNSVLSHVIKEIESYEK